MVNYQVGYQPNSASFVIKKDIITWFTATSSTKYTCFDNVFI